MELAAVTATYEPLGKPDPTGRRLVKRPLAVPNDGWDLAAGPAAGWGLNVRRPGTQEVLTVPFFLDTVDVPAWSKMSAATTASQWRQHWSPPVGP